MPAVLEVSALVKRFGGNRAVDGASFTVATGSITGLIGPNGAGKTTCFNCITGFLRPDGGTVAFDGADITGMASHRVFHKGLTRTFQIPQELRTMTVLENLMVVPAGQGGERMWENWFRPRMVARQERSVAQRAATVLEFGRPCQHGARICGQPLRRSAQAARAGSGAHGRTQR